MGYQHCRAAGYSVTFDDAWAGRRTGSGTLVRGGLTYREAHLAMERLQKRAACVRWKWLGSARLDFSNKTLS